MKKILFNNTYYLTDSVIMGIKDMTRRIIPFKTCIKWGVNKFSFDSLKSYLIRDAPYKIGEKVAVAQPYRECVSYIKSLSEFKSYTWEEMEAYLKRLSGWNNPMFVKAEWMPYYIEITNIRAEHLHDITDEECLREGIRICEFYKNEPRTYYYHIDYFFPTPREAFHSLIDRICAPTKWSDNPYVYAYEFKLMKHETENLD